MMSTTSVRTDEAAALRDVYPLVSVGIPTRNRAKYLQAAIDSVVAQDYPRIELIVSDNASTDETAEVCQAGIDSNRLVYVRQESNVGVVENFRLVRSLARGEFFMWLGDDDELSANYISSCLSALRADPAAVLAAGLAVHEGDNGFVFHEDPLSLLEADAGRRVLRYYRRVYGNSVFYGLMSRDVAARQHLRDVVGSDALFVAGLACLGNVVTIRSSSLRRNASAPDRASELAGPSGSTGSVRFARRFPWVSVAAVVLSDIGWVNPVYEGLTRRQRTGLALGSASIVLARAFGWQLKRSFNSSGRVALRTALTPDRYDVLRQWYRRSQADA